MPRRDQEMAKSAARLITDIGTITPEVRTRLIGLPFLIHRNGLAATLAFIASKSVGDKPLPRAYKKVDALLSQQIHESGISGATQFSSISDPASAIWLGERGSRHYLRLSAEVTDTLLWVKRFAEASKAQDATSADGGVSNE